MQPNYPLLAVAHLPANGPSDGLTQAELRSPTPGAPILTFSKELS